MNNEKKSKITAYGLTLLGLAMVIIGATGAIAPPIITGVGFFLLAWWVGSAGS